METDDEEEPVQRRSDIGTLTDPLATVLYLARVLRDRGVCLAAGDMVATGSCTGLTQVVPGQRVRAALDGWCQVGMHLT